MHKTNYAEKITNYDKAIRRGGFFAIILEINHRYCRRSQRG